MGAADGAVGDPDGDSGGVVRESERVTGVWLRLLWAEWFELSRVEGGAESYVDSDSESGGC